MARNRKETKDGCRSIHLHDVELSKAVERIAKEEGLHLYEVVETFIACGLNNEDPKEMMKERTVSEAVIDMNKSSTFIQTLLENGYTLHIKPTAGRTGLNERIVITFEYESEVK